MPNPAALRRNRNNNVNCKVNENISYLIPIRKNIVNFIISIPRIIKLYKLAKDITNTKHDLLQLTLKDFLY